MPFEFDDAPTPAEAERRFTSQKPDTPSHAVATETGKHPPPAVGNRARAQLARLLAGDLDTIVMKALRAEPERRYQSAAALAEDLRRYRAGLPVSARPDSLGYRARKFTTRHWKGLIATGAAFTALVIGLGTALWQADQARAERDRTQQINEFLQTILIEADPYESGAESTVRDVLRKADEMIEERFAGQPDLEAALRFTIGYTQLGLMELDASEINLRRADTLNHALYGPGDKRSLESRVWLAWLAFRRGDLDTAESGYRYVLDRLEPRHPWDFRASVLNEFGIILVDRLRYHEAIDYYQRSLAIWRAHDPERPEVATVYNNIGYAWHGLEELERAEEYYRRALEMYRARHPDGLHPDIAYNVNNLGIVLRDRGLRNQALPLYEESLAIRQATLGAMHAFTGMGHLNLGRLMLEMDRVEDARPHLRAALSISHTNLGEDQLQTLVARASMARLAFLDGDAASAAEELSAVHAAMLRSGAPENFIDQTAEWLAQARE